MLPEVVALFEAKVGALDGRDQRQDDVHQHEQAEYKDQRLPEVVSCLVIGNIVAEEQIVVEDKQRHAFVESL